MMMQSQDSVESEEWSLDCLPFDCIVCVCEFLTPEDLSRFARVCKTFQEASQIGYLWRRHCLSRWVFCDVCQIQEGPQRWRRYFLARRRVEARLDTGRPGRDYKVKTLRGHEKEITDAVVIGGSQVNWENPKPPLVVSLSTDGSVKAWDVLQAKAVWSVDGEKVVSIAGDSATLELAVGKADGSITLWDTQTWSAKATLQLEAGRAIATLKYVTVKAAKSTQTYLLVHSESFDVMTGQSGQLEVWDPKAAVELTTTTTTSTTAEAAAPIQAPTVAAAAKPLYVLWAPAHSSQLMQISSAHLLALPGRIGDVHVWDFTGLLSIKAPPPLPPNVTITTQEAVNSITWVGPGILATTSSWRSSVDLWDVVAHMEKLQKSSHSLYDDTNMHNPLRTIACDAPLVAISTANGLIIAGDTGGNVSVLDPSEKAAPRGPLQKFSDHKGSVMDIYADSFRVLTCSKDFSIRVYRWADRRCQQPKAAAAAPAQLESKYTLLGGSVAHKTHDGFKKLLCESGSCIGVAGNQLKFYTFYSKLNNIT